MTIGPDFALTRQDFPDTSEVPLFEDQGYNTVEAFLMSFYHIHTATDHPHKELAIERNKIRLAAIDKKNKELEEAMKPKLAKFTLNDGEWKERYNGTSVNLGTNPGTDESRNDLPRAD
jgi:hypothetical protein